MEKRKGGIDSGIEIPLVKATKMFSWMPYGCGRRRGPTENRLNNKAAKKYPYHILRGGRSGKRIFYLRELSKKAAAAAQMEKLGPLKKGYIRVGSDSSKGTGMPKSGGIRPEKGIHTPYTF